MLAVREGEGLRVSGECFDDEGISGATVERPVLQRLLLRVRSGAIGAVVVHRLDRLSRRVRDCSELLEEFKARGVQLFIAAANGPRRYVYFRCRTADGGGAPCKGTQVRAFDIEETVRSVLIEPGRAFPRKRGRPTQATVALYSLGQVLPLLDPNDERELIRKSGQEVVWNADSQGVRLTLELKALAERIPEPIGLATSVCRLDPGYRR